MLSKERIKEAETNVKSYLSEGLIKKESVNADVLRVFLRNAEESIASGEKLSSEGTSDLWVIVCFYYLYSFYIGQAGSARKSGPRVVL